MADSKRVLEVAPPSPTGIGIYTTRQVVAKLDGYPDQAPSPHWGEGWGGAIRVVVSGGLGSGQSPGRFETRIESHPHSPTGIGIYTARQVVAKLDGYPIKPPRPTGRGLG